MARHHRTTTLRAASTAALVSAAGFAVSPVALAGPVSVGVATRAGTPVLVLNGSPAADALTLGKVVGGSAFLITPGDATTVAVTPGDAAAASRCTPVDTALRCDLGGLGLSTPTTVSVEDVGVILGDGDDRLLVDAGFISGLDALAVAGGPGNDHVVGNRELDWFEGGPGHDYLAGYLGSDYLLGGDDNDFLHLASDDRSGGAYPADQDDSRSSCGTGTDMIFRDREPGLDLLTDLASCETDIGFADTSGIVSSVPNVALHPGVTVTVPWTSTRAAPTSIATDWQTCVQAPGVVSGTVTTYPPPECVTVATGDRWVVPAELLGQRVRARSRATWSVPGNPVTWSSGEYRGSPQEVRTVNMGGAPVVPPAGPSAKTVMEGIMRALTGDAGAKGAKPTRLSLKGRRTLITGDTGSHSIRMVVKLSVPRKALGQRGKGTVLIGRVDQTGQGSFSLNLKLNAAGKRLRARLGKTRKVNATLDLWLQATASRESIKGTKTVTLTAR